MLHKWKYLEIVLWIHPPPTLATLHPRNPRRDQVMGKNGWKNIGDENKINKLCGANLVSRSKLVVVVAAVGLDEVAFSFPFSLLWHPNFGRKMKDFAYKCVL